MLDRDAYKRQQAERDAKLKKPFRQRVQIFVSDSDRITQGLLTLFTFGLIVVGIQQCHILDKTDETSRIAQRPYIGVTGLQISTSTIPAYWTFRVLAENSGGTPPLGMQYVIIPSSSPPTDPDDIFQHPQPPFTIWHGTIAPKGNSYLIHGDAGIPANYFNSGNPFYVSGAVHYHDRFSGTHERITKFCYAVVAAKANDGSVKPAIDPCLYWNCTDDDCESDKNAYEAELRKLNPNLSKSN